MKIIFSPTKTMKKINNEYDYTLPNELLAKEIKELCNCMKEETNQAIFFYSGISFKYLDPITLDITYLNNHLIILSALYGQIRPLDKITEYRLDFTNKSLYKYHNIDYKDELVINLASNEYLKMVKGNNIINIIFNEYKNNKLTTSGTYNKMLRGLMLRYMCLNNITNINELHSFTQLDYKYNKELSNENNIVFTKGETI